MGIKLYGQLIWLLSHLYFTWRCLFYPSIVLGTLMWARSISLTRCSLAIHSERAIVNHWPSIDQCQHYIYAITSCSLISFTYLQVLFTIFLFYRSLVPRHTSIHLQLRRWLPNRLKWSSSLLPVSSSLCVTYVLLSWEGGEEQLIKASCHKLPSPTTLVRRMEELLYNVHEFSTWLRPLQCTESSSLHLFHTWQTWSGWVGFPLNPLHQLAWCYTCP